MGQPTGDFGDQGNRGQLHTAFEVSEEVLRLGSTGSAVANLQSRLQLAGLYRGAIDGSYGPNTASAVRQLQSSKKLAPDGVVGPATWAALNENASPPSTVLSSKTPKGFPFELGKGIWSFGRVSNDDGVYLRAQPDQTSSIKKKLPFNTRVFVGRELSGDWYFVTLGDGGSGFVYKKYVSLNPPADPGASLHKIKKNQGALAIVRQHYKKAALKWGEDERYYANVLVEANRGKGLRGIYKQHENAAWDTTQTRENYLIWIPSLEFAKSLRGKVGSGSISYELWQDVKAVATTLGNYYLGSAAFTAGLIHGALESVWDLLTGIIDLLEVVWKFVYSLLSGELLSDVKGLWDLVTSLNIRALADAGLKAFLDRWNAPDLIRRWHFRGWLVGYAIAEIVMAVLSGGAAVLKWAGKAGKLGQLLAKLPKLVKLAEKTKQLSKPLNDALQKLKKARARTLVKAQGKVKSFWSRLRPEKLAQARVRRALLRKKLKDARTKATKARKDARLARLTEANPVDMVRANMLRKFPKLLKKRLKHIIDGDKTGGGHGPLSTKPGKSKFNASTNIQDIITDTARTGTISPNLKYGKPRLDGSFRVEKRYPTPVGLNQAGQPVHSIRVVIDDAGAIITAFPIAP